MAWQAGLSDNVAHFRFTPGAHGGTVAALDDAASELIDPAFDRPVLRPVAARRAVGVRGACRNRHRPRSRRHRRIGPAPAPHRPPASSARKARPAVPGWEDVLLGVRSSGDR